MESQVNQHLLWSWFSKDSRWSHSDLLSNRCCGTILNQHIDVDSKCFQLIFGNEERMELHDNKHCVKNIQRLHCKNR